MKPTNLRARAGLVDHVRLNWREHVGTGQPVTNLIHKATGPNDAWIEEATNRIGDWRALIRSVYLRWALTINASVLAEAHYKALPADKALSTTTLRVVNNKLDYVPLAIWNGPEAADRYRKTTPLIAAYGVIDLFGALEDIIFELYEIALRHDPSALMQGAEYRSLRRIWTARSSSAEAETAWKQAWDERYEKWRRKRSYDGLHSVLLAFFSSFALKRPSQYRHTDISDWCCTLEMIGELRHHIIHGAVTISEKLGEMSNGKCSLTFDFVTGTVIDVQLHHLQSIECFSNQLLSAINLSLIEKAVAPIAKRIPI